MPLGLLAGLAGAGGLFGYNRENFFFDKQQQIKLEYQAQEMKIRQFELYREDVRDLVSLTTGKMENYLIVNTLQLGFCFTLFAEGRPKPGTEQWLVCLFTLCNAGAFLYYLLSMWLAMHASVSAHAFGVRLLTQFVRLPVPGTAELDRARAIAQDYEGLNVRDLLRVPVWKQQLRRLQAAMEDRAQEAASDAGSDAGDSVVEVTDPAMNPVAMMKHVQMFRKLQANWQSYDAYARVCMAMGTNQLLHTLSYCTLGLLVHENNVPIPAFSCVVIFTAGAFVLGKLDLYLSRRILWVAATLLVTPPVLTTISMACVRTHIGMLVWVEKALIVVVFFLHVAWIIFTVFVARADSFDGVSLPTKFRSVLFLDVFGWLAEDEDQELDQAAGAGGDEANPRPGAAVLTPVAEQYTFVMNEEAAESDSLPQNVRPILLADCLELQGQVGRDLQRWESHEVSQLLRESRAERRELRRLRRLFDALASELTRVAGPGEQAAPAASADRTEALPVYLQLEWNPEGEPMAYYYQCETEETLWETPAERCRISELQSLERDVVELGHKVRALARCQCSASRPSSQPASGEAARSGSSTSATLLHDPPAQAEQPDRSDVVERPPGAAGALHPQRGAGRRGRGGRGGHQPGRLPWSIVLYGSQTLIAAWLISTISVILSLAGVIRFDFEQPVTSEFEPLVGLVRMVGAEGWPHRFPRPVGLACAPAVGPVALVAERYAVHELRLDSGEFAASPTQLTKALEACLSRAPGFQGRGLADVGLDCSGRDGDGGSCSVTALGADGRHALRCRLDSGAAGAAAPLKLLGGPWQALAPGGGDAGWVLGGDRVPTQLRAHGTLENVLLPALDLLEGAAVRIAALHALGNHTLLGLESNGRLHAWPLGGGSVRSWRAPAVAGLLWTGLCATDGSLYLAGAEEGAGGAAGVWRAPLPPELRAALAGRPAQEPTLAVGAWKVYLR